ncbi:MAG: NDP-sugar synthase [Gammaproteobacteria bacterium]|nr:NDP-sugar synthase [Gammaproteobacteria bacterium]
MKTVILISNNNDGLKPLTDRTCQALLPIGGKPVIEHAIESLYSAGIREITIMLDADAEQVMSVVADGSRWDMRLHYELLGSDSSEIYSVESAGLSSNEVLLVRGDLLWSMDVQEFLQNVRETGQKRVYGVNGDTPIIIWTDGAVEYDSWETSNYTSLLENAPVRITVPTVNKLDSLAEYHQANIDLINARFPHLYPRGMESSNGFILDFGTKVSARNLMSGVACVGRNCNIHKSVQFEKNVVVGDRVLIDRGAKLENTVVLPDTYIGEMVMLKNSIVRGNTIILIDSGLVMELDDELLLADMGRSQGPDTALKSKFLSNFMFGESVSSSR